MGKQIKIILKYNLLWQTCCVESLRFSVSYGSLWWRLSLTVADRMFHGGIYTLSGVALGWGGQWPRALGKQMRVQTAARRQVRAWAPKGVTGSPFPPSGEGTCTSVAPPNTNSLQRPLHRVSALYSSLSLFLFHTLDLRWSNSWCGEVKERHYNVRWWSQCFSISTRTEIASRTYCLVKGPSNRLVSVDNCCTYIAALQFCFIHQLLFYIITIFTNNHWLNSSATRYCSLKCCIKINTDSIRRLFNGEFFS